MLGDILHTVASVEWIALGVFVIVRLRKLNKQIQHCLDSLQDQVDGYDEHMYMSGGFNET